MKKRNIIKKVSLMIVIIIITLLVIELALRVTYSNYANYNTEMWRYAKELKQKSSYPYQGHEHIQNKEAFLYGVEFKINSQGFRADKEFTVSKPVNVTRILVLGDSITVGWGVEYNESYPKKLENLLNKNSDLNYEVINTGVGNYNTKSELATLKKNLNFEPDIIILGFYINDIEEIQYCQDFLCWIKMQLYTYAFIYDKFTKLKYDTQYNYKNYYSELYIQEEQKNNLKKDINTIIKIAQNNSIELIFVNIPELHELREYPFEKVNNFLEEEIINNSNIKYINLLWAFENQTPEDMWVSYEDTHPNAAGHQIIAEEIYKLMT